MLLIAPRRPSNGYIVLTILSVSGTDACTFRWFSRAVFPGPSGQHWAVCDVLAGPSSYAHDQRGWFCPFGLVKRNVNVISCHSAGTDLGTWRNCQCSMQPSSFSYAPRPLFAWPLRIKFSSFRFRESLRTFLSSFGFLDCLLLLGLNFFTFNSCRHLLGTHLHRHINWNKEWCFSVAIITFLRFSILSWRAPSSASSSLRC